jgi:hypothetical protein
MIFSFTPMHKVPFTQQILEYVYEPHNLTPESALEWKFSSFNKLIGSKKQCKYGLQNCAFKWPLRSEFVLHFNKINSL